MTAIVSVETVLLVVLVILVAGLLRSHAEILRRLGPDSEAADAAGAPLAAPDAAGAPAAAGTARRRPAPPIQGVTPAGDAVALDFERAAASYTLLAFLTSGCGTCAGFWQTLAEPRLPANVDTVIVTHGSERERPAGVRALAPSGIPVVMSEPAWRDYEVPGAPYFVLVEREILGEGVAGSWHALASLVSDALEEELEARVAAAAGPPASASARARRVDETLAAGGIAPGHPSLYPGGPPSS